MTNADIPYMISDALMGISDNPLIILLLINIVLLIVGIFMDMTPAVLIFTPIFLPIAQELGNGPCTFRYYDGGQPLYWAVNTAGG